MMSVRGQLTFMRVTEDKIATAATTLECMGLTKHIVVLISGKMTFGQLQAVKDRTRVRTDKLIAAVKWLVANHRDWKNVNFEKIKDKIHHTQPVRVDKSTTVQSGNASIEEEVVFTCYFPDGKANTHAGGFQSPTDFKEFVDTMKRNNYNIELKSEMEKEFVNGKTIDHLVGACVIQFPYGVGGLKEQRELECGKLSSIIDLPSFLDHLSRKSQTEFQTPLFQLIMYSMLSRTRLLRTSCLQLQNKVNAETLAQGFNAKDFSRAAKGRSNWKRHGTKASNILLDAVDATARDLPHTKEGSKKGRSSMEAMHHHFGMGSVFLTVTFDDENSFNIQVLSGIEIDDDTPIEDLSDKELAERASRRQSLRVEFPGIAALNFEMMLDILLEEVIGWDIDLNESSKWVFLVKFWLWLLQWKNKAVRHSMLTLYYGLRGMDNCSRTCSLETIWSKLMLRSNLRSTSTKFQPPECFLHKRTCSEKSLIMTIVPSLHAEIENHQLLQMHSICDIYVTS